MAKFRPKQVMWWITLGLLLSFGAIQFSMDDPDTWFYGFAALPALFFVGTGSWVIHRKVRTRASLIFVSSIALLLAWFVLLSPAAEYLIIGAAAAHKNNTFLYSVYIAEDNAIPALLLLVSAASFFAMARSLKPAV